MYIDGLDEFDNKILTLLEKNARMSYSDIGEQVGLSRVSVKNRMDALEKKGIIRGYTAVIDSKCLPEGRRFYMDVITDPDMFEQAIDIIAREDVICRVCVVSGECRIKAEGYAPNSMKYEAFMRNARRNLKGVKNISLQDVHYTVKDVDRGIDYVSSYEYD